MMCAGQESEIALALLRPISLYERREEGVPREPTFPDVRENFRVDASSLEIADSIFVKSYAARIGINLFFALEDDVGNLVLSEKGRQ